MGITKQDIFTNKQNKIATIAKALSHPARVAILEHIISTDSCICSNLVDKIDLSQATISQHLKVLKESWLIKWNLTWISMCYCMDYKQLNIFKEFLKNL